MKNKEMKVKAMSMAVAMSMVVGLCPSTIFAATGSQTAKDGTYTKTAHVTRTEDDSDDEWNEYDVEVSLKVEDGKFSEITVTPKEGYDEENASYFKKAYSKPKDLKQSLKDRLLQKIQLTAGIQFPVQHVLLMRLKKLHLKQSSQLRQQGRQLPLTQQSLSQQSQRLRN